MKKLALLMVLVMVSTVVFAGDFDKIQTNHKNAMKFYGKADLLAQRDAKMMFVNTGSNVASVFVGTDMSTGYMENADKKIYWEVTPIEGGIKITIKINVFGKIIEKVIIIKYGEKDLGVKVEASDDRVDPICIIKCAGSAALKCLPCATNWVCWATCAGPDVVSCIMGCF